jgi:membrane-associated PAP2 superfamily phosphatase
MIASIFLYLALFFALIDENKTLSIFALTVGLIGLAIYFPSNTSIEMLSVSKQYAQAVAEQEKTILLASGQTLYSIWKGTSYAVYYVLNGIALILFFSAMTKNNKFRKITAYVGLTSGILMTVPATAGIIGMTMALLSLIPWSIFSILVIKDFRELIRKNVA